MTYFSIPTDIGDAKLAAATAGTPLRITEMAVGDGNGQPTVPAKDQTALVNEVYRTDLNRLETVENEPTQVLAEAIVPSEVGGWDVREVGLFDEVGDLIFVANFPLTYKPSGSEGSLRDLVIQIYAAVSDAALVELVVSPSAVAATREWVVSQIESSKDIEFVDLLGDVATLKLSHCSEIRYSGDVVINQNPGRLLRRSSFDDSQKAGSAPEIAGGTMFVFDVDGAAFIDAKEPIKRRQVSNGKLSSRQVHIYRWGSPYSGNDWCFVRTPDSYEPAGQPHAFVILNHGNGWIMDGSEATANFSSKTQFGVDTQNGGTYLDTNRDDYVEYSSPLIEAFLADGYVVCGAQNAGDPGAIDAGYGNREVQQNIMFFYQHVVNNYNVKDHCHMIAASNGSIGTLNAVRLMGRDRVRSVTLLYPLINLYEAWLGAYQTQVAAAYNFDGDPTNFAAFVDGTRGYDPMVASTDYSMITEDLGWTEANYQNTNFLRLYFNDSGSGGDDKVYWLRENRLVNSSVATDLLQPLDDMAFYRRSVFPWPRIRCHYSLTDTVTPPELHWLAFEKLLDRGGHVNFGVEVSGSHGDYTHFELLDGTGVAAMIAWTKL